MTAQLQSLTRVEGFWQCIVINHQKIWHLAILLCGVTLKEVTSKDAYNSSQKPLNLKREDRMCFEEDAALRILQFFMSFFFLWSTVWIFFPFLLFREESIIDEVHTGCLFVFRHQIRYLQIAFCENISRNVSSCRGTLRIAFKTAYGKWLFSQWSFYSVFSFFLHLGRKNLVYSVDCTSEDIV